SRRRRILALFPYTTLFRSARESCSDSGVKGKKSRERYLSAGRTACIALPVSTSPPFCWFLFKGACAVCAPARLRYLRGTAERKRSEEHTSELQSRENLVCR